MAAQVGVSAVVVQPGRLLQLVKHRHKALRLKPRLRHHAKAHAVCLALHFSRKIELVLHCYRLATHHQGAACIRAFAGRQRAQHHGANHPGCLLVLLGHQAGNVALGDVAQLMPQHRGQLVAAGHHRNQTQVHAQVAAGHGKGIHRAVLAQHDFPGKALVQFRRQITPQTSRRHQGLPNALHILG